LLLILAAWPCPAGERPTPDWLDLEAEYRVQTTWVDPLELNGTVAQSVSYTEQRLRLEPTFRLAEVGRIVTRLDLLDGVLFGDNGEYGGDPSAGSGMGLSSRWPNSAGWTIGLLPGRDPLNPDSYGPRLVGVAPVKVVHAWGEVVLPFGVLRVGRQPAASGPGINLHDGSRSNRWGVSRYSATADRVLFATKLSEAFRMLRAGSDHVPDRSMDDGVFLAAAWDQVVEDDVSVGGDDLHQLVGMLQWKARRPGWFGLPWQDFSFQVVVGGRFGRRFDTDVVAIPVSLDFGVGRVRFRGEVVPVLGTSREISEGLAPLREADPARRVIHDQQIRMFGAQAVLDVTTGPLTSTLEFDYASGDADPRDSTALTTYSFDRDANLGLLLFEHLLAFETARSAAVGIQNLNNLGTGSFPLTELSSEGRVQNAICLFPQLLYRPVEGLGIRAGALFAWSAAPVVDPVMTLLAEDGERISDDAVNWNGGKPARYYGTELDLQLEWAFRRHFTWTLEGAAFLPGAAMRDESDDAVPSFLVQNRFTFVF
jgi:hypothetical protein